MAAEPPPGGEAVKAAEGAEEGSVAAEALSPPLLSASEGGEAAAEALMPPLLGVSEGAERRRAARPLTRPPTAARAARPQSRRQAARQPKQGGEAAEAPAPPVLSASKGGEA